MRYCGREFSASDLRLIRQIIDAPDTPNRAEISRRVCRRLAWLRPNGALKDMSCRVALLRMERDDLIGLPPPRNPNGNQRRSAVRLTEQSNPGPPIITTAGRLRDLRLQPVLDRKQSRLWNELIARYHYLGYTPINGAQYRYLVVNDGHLLGALGFGSAAWKMAPRDRWIGWDSSRRQTNLIYIANNYRFLILPWVEVKNLASKILASAAKQLPGHWRQRYGYPVVLLETLVEANRFRGTCYRAANWVHIGQTTGRGKWGTHDAPLPIKDIYVLPLAANAKSVLRERPDVLQ